MSKNLIVIGGPTAVGKTSLAITLAKSLSTEIISADSRQIYNELNIGTAKPSDDELKAVKHHFIDHISIQQEYNAGLYEREAEQLLQELFTTHENVIVVGGSGLYIKALTEGLDDLPGHDAVIRDELNKTFEKQGLVHLQEELKRLDPVHYAKIDINNHRRIIRALEIIRVENRPLSEIQANTKNKKGFNTISIGLERGREALYDIINHRVDAMIEAGLVDEVRQLVAFQDLPSLQTVGYSELFSHFNGEYDLAEAIRLIKRNTRRYAKRQMTWFKNRENMNWFSPDQVSNIKSFLATQMS